MAMGEKWQKGHRDRKVIRGGDWRDRRGNGLREEERVSEGARRLERKWSVG